MIRDQIISLLEAAPITGRRAIFYTLIAAGLPTAVRAAVDGFVSGCELTIYLPFVLMSVVFVGWKYATATALSSAGSACSIYSMTVFFTGSAILITFVHVLRRLITLRLTQLGSRKGGIVFSSEDGQARASWYGQNTTVQLGPQSEVVEMMEDFLAQVELGKRLTAARS